MGNELLQVVALEKERESVAIWLRPPHNAACVLLLYCRPSGLVVIASDLDGSNPRIFSVD